LDGIERIARVITVQDFELNQNIESYLELDYKCDMPFDIEMQLQTPSNAIVVVDLLSIRASTEWNKIYINLTDDAKFYSGSKINFILTANLTPGQSNGFVSIDNLKIITQ